MNVSSRDKLIFCVGKMKGILSMLEFEEDDPDSQVVSDKLNDVVNDMELLLYGVDDIPNRQIDCDILPAKGG